MGGDLSLKFLVLEQSLEKRRDEHTDTKWSELRDEMERARSCSVAPPSPLQSCAAGCWPACSRRSWPRGVASPGVQSTCNRVYSPTQYANGHTARRGARCAQAMAQTRRAQGAGLTGRPSFWSLVQLLGFSAVLAICSPAKCVADAEYPSRFSPSPLINLKRPTGRGRGRVL